MKNTNIIKKLTAALLALALTSSLAACAPSTARNNEQENGAYLTVLSQHLTTEEAKQQVEEYLNVSDAQFIERETELDDGKYEFEVITDDIEYSFEVDAQTGEIVEIDRETRKKNAAGNTNSTAPTESKNDTLTIEEAKALVLAHLGVSDATFIDRETDLDDGKFEFEVITSEYEYDVEVNVRTGAIVEVDREPVEKKRTSTNTTTPPATKPAKTNYLTVDEARALALAYVGVSDAKVIDRETELDDGKYEFEVITSEYEYDIEVNAKTGAIVEVDREPIEKKRTSTNTTTPPATEPAKTNYLTVDEARALALAYVGASDAKVIDRETDLDDGKFEFEIVTSEYEYDIEVNVKTGAIVEVDRERIAKPAETIGMDAAKALVLAHLGDANAVFTDAELDDGVYEFEVRSGKAEYDYKVDAVTGEILKAQRDD